ncbi:MAG: hypothetical protein WKG06_33260 [Segetibacter sp.]
MDEKVEQYIIDIVFATRYPEKFRLERLKPLISYGGSPQGKYKSGFGCKSTRIYA